MLRVIAGLVTAAGRGQAMRPQGLRPGHEGIPAFPVADISMLRSAAARASSICPASSSDRAMTPADQASCRRLPADAAVCAERASSLTAES